MDADDLADFNDNAQAALEALFPCTIKVPADGQAYAAARGRFSSTLDPSIENLAEDYDVSVRIRRALLAADDVEVIPQQTLVDVDGEVFRVERVIDIKSDPAIYLGLKQQ